MSSSGYDDRSRDLLVVDYSKPYPDVYRDATRYAVLMTKPSEAVADLPFILRWISHCDGFDFNDSSFPSWVPRPDLGTDFSRADATLAVHGTRPAT